MTYMLRRSCVAVLLLFWLSVSLSFILLRLCLPIVPKASCFILFFYTPFLFSLFLPFPFSSYYLLSFNQHVLSCMGVLYTGWRKGQQALPFLQHGDLVTNGGATLREYNIWMPLRLCINVHVR